jgi:hypothetical protein
MGYRVYGSQYKEIPMAGNTFKVQHKPFVFTKGMKIGKDLEPQKRDGWRVVRGGHVLGQEPNGTLTVTLTLRRLVRVK